MGLAADSLFLFEDDAVGGSAELPAVFILEEVIGVRYLLGLAGCMLVFGMIMTHCSQVRIENDVDDRYRQEVEAQRLCEHVEVDY